MLNEFRETAITWDKANRKIYESLRASAGDNKGRKLSVQLVNDGVIEDLSGASLSLFWETRDKAHKGLDAFTAVDATKGEFEIYYTTGMLSNEGTLNANLVLVDTSGRVVSEPFKITVFKGIDDEAVQSSDSFTALTEALAQVSTINNKADRAELLALESTFEQNKVSVEQQLQETEQEIADLETNKADKSVTATKGELNNAVSPKADRSYVDVMLDDKREKTVKIEPEDLSQATHDYVKGGTVNLLSIPQDNSVEGIKLKNNFSFKGNLTTEDLNAALDSGIYSTSVELPNKPSNAGNTAIISVRRIGGTGTYVIQEYTDVLNPANLYRRICRIGYSSGPWYKVQVGDIPTDSLDAKVLKDATVSTTKLTSNYTYKGSKGATDDLNTINTAGLYLYTEQAPNMPTGFSSGLLSVETTGSFTIQEFQSISGDYDEVYRRVILPNAGIYKTWYKLVNQDMIADNKVTKPLEGKTIVQFGDSIYGNNRPPNDISTALANKTGATVHNLGIGGSKMSAHAQYWDATSMYRLADAIATGDYTLQDEVIARRASGDFPTLPYYVPSVLELMKTIVWDDVDIITIAHGTNDYTSTDAVLDNESNRYDTTTYGGALRYSLKTILEAYPHIKVVVISPMYRFWTENEAPYNFIIDSDEEVLNGNKLIDYVVKAREISAEEKTEYIDAYTHFGIGKSNRHYHFDDLTGKGGTHHNNNGAKYIGEKLGSEIVAKF